MLRALALRALALRALTLQALALQALAKPVEATRPALPAPARLAASLGNVARQEQAERETAE